MVGVRADLVVLKKFWYILSGILLISATCANGQNTTVATLATAATTATGAAAASSATGAASTQTVTGLAPTQTTTGIVPTPSSSSAASSSASASAASGSSTKQSSEATTVVTSAPATTAAITSTQPTSATVTPTSASVADNQTTDASHTVKTSGSMITPSSSASSAKTSAPPPPPHSTTLVVTSTVKPTTSPSERTCARLSFVVNASWDEAHGNKSSDSYKAVSGNISNALTMLYVSEKHSSVVVSEVTLTEKDKMIHAELKLCLVFNGNDDDSIEVVFINLAKTGKLSGNLLVIKDSAEFVALGVNFKDWKAKDGECDKCEGAAGEFMIEATCEAKTSSCNGLKNIKMTKDCVTYCPSNAAAAITAASSFILAIGILVFLSFQ